MLVELCDSVGQDGFPTFVDLENFICLRNSSRVNDLISPFSFTRSRDNGSVRSIGPNNNFHRSRYLPNGAFENQDSPFPLGTRTPCSSKEQ